MVLYRRQPGEAQKPAAGAKSETPKKERDTKMYKIEIELIRANGSREVIDATAKLGGMTPQLAETVRRDNARVGTRIVRISVTRTASNLSELEDEYARGMLEGGEGYIPDMTKDPRYMEWVETVEY